MLVLCSFDYAVMRVVPRVEREEFINAGVILFCRERRFLGALIRLSVARLAALDPEIEVEAVQAHLDLIPRICAGEPETGALGRLSLVERFRWLTSPRSTIIQVSPVHGGLCSDPEQALRELLHAAVP